VTPEFVIGSYHQLFQIEKSFRMAKSDLQARPIYHQTRDSIEAYLTIVLAALAVSRWIESTTGWSIRRLAGRARRYRTVQIQAGDHVITAADPLPDDLRDALSKITSTPCGAHYFGRSQVRAVYQAGPRRLRWCKGGQARASAAGQGILPGCPGPRRKGKNG
jgi:hypothetical protein